MKALSIHYLLYRSNPAIMRSLEVPSLFPADQLESLACLSLGLNPSDCYREIQFDFSLTSEEFLHAPEAETLSAVNVLLPGMTGKVRIAKDSPSSRFLYLEIYFRVSEGTEETITAPVLKGWTGYQLPAGIFSISAVNEMQAGFMEKSSYLASSGELLYRDQQQFNLKKVQNAINQQYAPDKVKDEVRMELGIPMRDLLDQATLPELKQKLHDVHRYGFDTQKKANCVAALAEELEHLYFDRVFNQMEMKEYLNFRQLVLHGSSSCKNNEEIMHDFPVLWSEMQIRFVKKQGIRLSRESLLAYEKWFDGPEEILFRKNKKIRQAMRWCSFYYGIFSIKHCYRVINTVYPNEITKEDLISYWEKTPDLASPEHVRFTGSSFRTHSTADYAYDTRVISSAQSELYLAAVRKDSSPRKLPSDPDSFEAIATKSLHFSNDDPEIKQLAARYSYGYDTDKISEKLNEGIDMMRKGSTGSGAAAGIISHMYLGYSKKDAADVITKYLEAEDGKIPQFLYYGFTTEEIQEQGIRSLLTENYHALQKEQAVRKRAEKKALRKTIPYSTGKGRK